jgi:hypothetical protein
VDLIKVWPYGDCPLVPVRTLRLDRNPENDFVEIEPAAFEPFKMLAGIGPAPDMDAAGPAVTRRVGWWSRTGVGSCRTDRLDRLWTVDWYAERPCNRATTGGW